MLESSPSRPEIERQEVGPRMEVRFQSEHSLEQILAALDEVTEIIVAELVAESGAAQEPSPATTMLPTSRTRTICWPRSRKSSRRGRAHARLA